MYAITLAVLVLGSCGLSQDKPEEKKMKFNFKDASIDDILKYVSSETGWIFVQEKAVTGKVNAECDTEIPVSHVLDYLDTVLRYHCVTTINPHSPDLPKPGQIVKIVEVEQIKKRSNNSTPAGGGAFAPSRR